MVFFNTKSGARLGALVGIAGLALAAAACGSSSSSSPPKSSPAASKPTGTANVAYAASLEFLNEKVAGPAFTKATGFGYSGHAGASGELSSDIAGGVLSPNVFESVGGDNITPLFPKFTKWYVQYAATSIVVAYNPKSKYASDFKAYAAGTKPLQDLFKLMETPGFKLGRTDPNIDPQGRAFIYMLQLAQAHYNLPGNTVNKILGTSNWADPSSPQIFAESSLDSTLQSGQLDAASAYINQAIELHLPYIVLPPEINLGDAALATQYAKAHITITVKGVKTPKTGSPLVIDITTIGKPTDAGTAFVKFTLSPAGLALYKAGGYALLKPTVSGTASAVPSAISSELG